MAPRTATTVGGPGFSATDFRRRLLRWYDHHRRALPWRGERDPYRIWISEIMLQQTRASVVCQRYPRFLRRFPRLSSLARAPLSSVLAEWSGLGYYRRARALHQASRIIARSGSNLPRNFQEWLSLPGIGRYTAAAIASIAFGEPVAAVDGNIERVLSRLLARGQGSRRSPSGADIWQHAGHLLSRQRPGDFNQAMMELGATICLPARPACGVCPVAKFCGWHAHITSHGRISTAAETLPMLRKKTARKKVRISYRILERGGAIYLVQRPRKARLMPAMWELPAARSRSSSSDGIRLRHSITSTDYEVFVRRERIVAEPRASSNHGRWIKISRLEALALTGLARKILCRAALLGPPMPTKVKALRS